MYYPNTIYHLYSEGNNQQIIFPQRRNYFYFLEKMEKHLQPHVEIMAYCLMPNHVHLLIQTTPEACQPAKRQIACCSESTMQLLSQEIGYMLSHYTKGVNKQEGWTGSLFRQRTRVKKSWPIVEGKLLDYSTLWIAIYECMDYIHQSPVRAGIVAKASEWPFSTASRTAQQLRA